jgi:hypothetical protein
LDEYDPEIRKQLYEMNTRLEEIARTLSDFKNAVFVVGAFLSALLALLIWRLW